MLLIATLTFAQQPETATTNTTCDLEQNNESWLVTFKAEKELGKKLELIHTKINSNTSYTVYKPQPSTTPTVASNKIVCSSLNSYKYADANGNRCGNKILFFVRNTAKDFLKIDLLEHPSYAPLLAALHAENTTIDLLEGTQATALFGFNGMAGVVLLNVQDKQIEAQLKQLMQNNNT